MQRRALALALTALVVVAGCQNTFDESAVTTTTDASTTTTVPPGTTVELLDRLVAGAPELSHMIVDGRGQRELLAELDALWARARPDVVAESPALAGQMDAAVALLHSGVDKLRPADADKGAMNLATLVARFTTAGSTPTTTA